MSAPAALPPIPPNIALLAGPPLIGIMLNWFLFGGLCVQTYIYSLNFKDDKAWFRCLVYILVLIETAQTILVTNDAFQWFAYGFGNMISLSKPYTSFVDAPIMDGFVALAVQFFFAWRIFVLSKSRVLAAFIGLVSVVQCAGALAGGIRSYQIDDVTKMQSSTVYLGLWMAGSAVSDTLIAISMITLLIRHNSTAFRGSDMLRQIVSLTVETNAITAAVAILGVILWKAFPAASLFMTPSFMLGKLYSNTLLVVFNNRILMKKGEQTFQGTNDRETWQDRSRSFNIAMPNPPPPRHHEQISIDIIKQTEVDVDSDFPRAHVNSFNKSGSHDLAFQAV